MFRCECSVHPHKNEPLARCFAVVCGGLVLVHLAPTSISMAVSQGSLTRHVKLRIAHARECRERFPRHRLQKKPLVSDPSMHHGTCITHMPWCMSGSLARAVAWKRSRHSRRMRSPQLYESSKIPMGSTLKIRASKSLESLEVDIIRPSKRTTVYMFYNGLILQQKSWVKIICKMWDANFICLQNRWRCFRPVCSHTLSMHVFVHWLTWPNIMRRQAEDSWNALPWVITIYELNLVQTWHIH